LAKREMTGGCGGGLLARAKLSHVPGVALLRRGTVKVAADSNRAASRKGKQFEKKNRRRGRPAWLRTPYDSPLRDGNRDRLIGLLTERAAKTLMVYLMETNPTVYQWLVNFYKANPIPKNGSWDDVSGETFLRKLLSMPIETACFDLGRDALFSNAVSCGVDPRNIAQRIMDIRTQLSEEFVQELQCIAEENSLLLREALTGSLSSLQEHPLDPADAAAGKEAKPTEPTSSTSSTSASAAASSAKESSAKPSRSAPTSNSSSSLSSKASSSLPSPPPPSPAKASSKPSTPAAGKSNASSAASPAAGGGDLPQDKAAMVAALTAAFSKEVSADVLGARHPELGDADVTSDKSGDKGTKAAADEGGAAKALDKSSSSSGGVDGLSSISFASSLSQGVLPRGLDLMGDSSLGGDSTADAAAPSADAAAADLGSVSSSKEAQVQVEGTLPAAPAAEAVVAPIVGQQGEEEVGDKKGDVATAAAVVVAFPKGWGPAATAAAAATATAATALLIAGLPKGWGPRAMPAVPASAAAANNIVSSSSLKRGGGIAGEGVAGVVKTTTTAAAESSA